MLSIKDLPESEELDREAMTAVAGGYYGLSQLGTVADIVPLLGENRIITHFGLTELTAGRRPGVAALKEMAGMLSREVAVGQVAFRLAPRINAVGRLGEASSAVELLTTNSYSSALSMARELEKAGARIIGTPVHGIPTATT